MSIIQKTATEQLALLRSGEITSVELTQAYLNRINQVEPAIGAFLRVESEAALTQAAEVDRKRGECCDPLQECCLCDIRWPRA